MINAKVDTTRFERDLKLYLKETSKTVVDAINYKLFDATRAAIKGTDKANKNTIRESLQATSNKYPARTVAEMLVIKQSHLTGDDISNLQDEAKALTKSRYSTIGFTKAGWLPALKKLLPHVGRESVSIGGVSVKENKFGGAEIARMIGNQVIGESYNDVAGTGNQAHVESIKEHGAQVGIDKVTNDIETYLAKKLDIPIEKFNRE